MGERLRFVFRNFPITTSHPHAQQAAEAAEAAAAQGRFWRMHDLLYENQRRLRDEDLRAYAERLGLDLGAFDQELADHVHAERVREDFMSGVRSGVNGTPTFYINGARHDDSYEIETLLAALSKPRPDLGVRRPRACGPSSTWSPVGELRIESSQRLDEHGRDRDVPHPLAVGWDHVPGRPVRGGRCEGLVVRGQ